MQTSICEKAPRPIGLWMVFGLMVAACVAMVGCDPSNKDTYVPQVVLQGQMYVGQAPEIRLIHTIPTGDYFDPESVGISGADVVLTADDLKEIENRMGAIAVQGHRYPEAAQAMIDR